jgi:hypothetical protein
MRGQPAQSSNPRTAARGAGAGAGARAVSDRHADTAAAIAATLDDILGAALDIAES